MNYWILNNIYLLLATNLLNINILLNPTIVFKRYKSSAKRDPTWQCSPPDGPRHDPREHAAARHHARPALLPVGWRFPGGRRPGLPAEECSRVQIARRWRALHHSTTWQLQWLYHDWITFGIEVYSSFYFSCLSWLLPKLTRYLVLVLVRAF